ncbi:hypothetical protein ACWC2K_33700, partial [Streptomyces chattanoogensis]
RRPHRPAPAHPRGQHRQRKPRHEGTDLHSGLENGVVTVAGSMDAALIPQLLESVRDIEDVVEVIDHLKGTT